MMDTEADWTDLHQKEVSVRKHSNLHSVVSLLKRCCLVVQIMVSMDCLDSFGISSFATQASSDGKYLLFLTTFLPQGVCYSLSLR
jgi:hypothetical protein